MLNLTTIQDGFVMHEFEFYFDGDAEVLDATQAHVPTNRGIILCDTTMTVDGESFNKINDFLTKLYG